MTGDGRRSEPRESGVPVPPLGELLGRTRRHLLEHARRVGLTGIHRLTKAALAARLEQALGARAVAPPAPDVPRKFDLGRMSSPAGEHEDIPWGHGQDRVTAMVVDPERLYVYWEVTDEAIEWARAELGPGGRDASLNVRVYDVTDRIFDGTNAHHYFDHGVSRLDRQWFFFIGRPSSTVIVELGVKSQDDRFVRIVRSGRANFPRRTPTPPGGVEWLTVRSASGDVGEPVTESRPPRSITPEEGGTPVRPEPELVRAWDIRRTHSGSVGDRAIRDGSVGMGWEADEWMRQGTVEWEGPMIRIAWEAGPFSYPVEPARYVEERWDGAPTVHSVEGRTRMVHGPWRVVIRGLGARAERRILAVWEIHRSWLATSGVAVRTGTVGEAPGVGGASEQVLLGGTEVHWLAGSELRLGGASELYRLGASELRYLGASETLYAGASEWRTKGASELHYLGASQWPERGASEIRFAGASEQVRTGASGAPRRYPAPPSPGG